MSLPLQRSFDDMGAHLFDVPFCVLDLETTGGSAADCEITEIGAVRYRAGELEGTFQTLVDPGSEIPPFITVLTGITHAMVINAPKIGEAYPTFLEFLGDAVIVGHNVRFDLGFLNAAGERLGYGRLPNRSVDTAGLARRLVRSEVRNLKLGTLAAHFRSPVTPNHRALEDARATAHVLWSLLERAGSLGVTHLEDLLTLPTARGSADYRKIELADALPRAPGVYLMKDRDGVVFYIGKAKNLRTRVRSYFYGDTRRRVAQMLRELVDIDHRVCETELEAEITELRLIGAHRPRHNRRLRPPKSPHWIRLTDEAFPRLSMVRNPRGAGLLTLGPFSGQRTARVVVEAIWDALPIRRCTHRPGSRPSLCGAAQLGRAVCPADGTVSEESYRPVVERLITGIDHDPSLLLEPLVERVSALARSQRFEEAGWVRDRHAALYQALARRRRWLALQECGLVRAEADDGTGALVERGRMIAAWRDGGRPPLAAASPPGDLEPEPVPPTMSDATEANLVWKWLTSGAVRLIDSSGSLQLPRRPVPVLDRIEV